MSAIDAARPVAAAQIDERDKTLSRTRRRVLLLTLALVIAAAIALSYRTAVLFEERLGPEVLRKSETVAEFLAADIERAIGYGIPLNKLVGVSEYFAEKRAGHPEIDFIALHGANGVPLHVTGSYLADEKKDAAEAAARQLFAGGEASAAGINTKEFYVVMKPVRGSTGVVAVVAVGTDPQFVHHQLQELAFDVLTILLVSLFLAFEIAIALLATSAVVPMNQLLGMMRAAANGDLRGRLTYRANNEIGRAIGRFNDITATLNERYARLAARVGTDVTPDLRGRLHTIGERFGLVATGPVETKPAATAIDVRLPLFIFILAEELQKSFLPLYVGTLEGDIAWLSPAILISLPISVYMLTLALATPFAGSWADRYGTRRIFLLGLVPAFAGFVGAALAATVVDLIFFRAMTAIGYAMCTIAAQGFIVQVTASSERTQGISTFVGVLMAASICGTAIGGILADRIGYRAVFACASILALLAGALALRMLASGTGIPAGARERSLRLGDLRLMLSNWRFVALLLFAAIPGKIVLTGFLFYAVPIYLTSLGNTEAEIGRVMMSYSLVIVFLAPWLGKVADRKDYGWWMIFLGTLLSGLALVLLSRWSDLSGVLAAVLLVALAHAASISPQVALLPDICAREIEKIGQTTALGILRMLERIGSVAGPLLVAGLVAQFGFVDALVLVGLALAVLSPILLTVFIGSGRSRGA